MKIKEGFEVRNVCGEYVIVATGRKNIDFSKIIYLNESAALVWNAVKGKDFTADDVADILVENYDVEREEAYTDAQTLLSTWHENGLTEMSISGS